MKLQEYGRAGDLMGKKKGSKPGIPQPLPAESDMKVYEAIRIALAEARVKVVVEINTAMVGAYWEVGRQFCQTFPICYALRSESSWSHYRWLMIREIEEHGDDGK